METRQFKLPLLENRISDTSPKFLIQVVFNSWTLGLGGHKTLGFGFMIVFDIHTHTFAVGLTVHLTDRCDFSQMVSDWFEDTFSIFFLIKIFLPPLCLYGPYIM